MSNELSFIINTLVLSVSIIATFISANSKMKIIYKFLIMTVSIAIYLLVFMILMGQTNAIVWIGCGVLAFIIITNIFLYKKTNYMPKSKISKKMLKFTEDAAAGSEIQMITGDMNFFGDVGNKTIENNQQVQQLIHLCKDNRCKVQILTINPYNNNNEETYLRIGFLKEKLGQSIDIRYYNILDCAECSVKDMCVRTTKKCKDCPFSKCYIPDPDIRIRFIKDMQTSGVKMISTYRVKGALYHYPRIEIKSLNNSKSFHLYEIIWKILWENSDRTLAEKICNECINKYKFYLLDKKA